MRMAPTSLDNWLYFLRSDYKTEEEFIAELQRKRPPTMPMKRGIAFHSYVERMHALAQEGDPPFEDPHNGWAEFGGEQFRFLHDEPLALPDGECEQWGSLDFDDLDIQMRGRADVIDLSRRTIHDYKTSEKPVDIEGKYDAMQWRVYLLMYQCDRFVFHCYRLKREHRTSDQEWRIADTTVFDQYAYEGMEEDVRRVAADLADFRRSRGLETL